MLYFEIPTICCFKTCKSVSVQLSIVSKYLQFFRIAGLPPRLPKTAQDRWRSAVVEWEWLVATNGGATCSQHSPHSCHLQTDPAGRQHTGASISDIWMYFRYLKVFWTSVWFSGFSGLREDKGGDEWRLFCLPAFASLSLLLRRHHSRYWVSETAQCGRARWQWELPCSLASFFSPLLPLRIGSPFRFQPLEKLKCAVIAGGSIRFTEL